jgi:hypothetical protein
MESEAPFVSSSEEEIAGSGSSWLGWLGAFAAGAAAGAAVALLYAPARGRETRDRIGGRVQDAADKIRAAARRRFGRAGTAPVATEELPPGLFAGTPPGAAEPVLGGNGGEI